MSVTLVEFLTARLDEDDEAITQAERDAAANGMPTSMGPLWTLDPAADSEDGAYRAVEMTLERARADVEAKRRIVEQCAEFARDGDNGAELVATIVLDAFAQPYAAHPDFDPAWEA